MAQPATSENPETTHPGAAPGGDSIGEQLEARLAQLPAVPSDAMDWASLAALYEREAAALGTDPSAARLLHEAGRIHEERLADPAGALAYYRRAAASDRLFRIYRLPVAWQTRSATSSSSATSSRPRQPR